MHIISFCHDISVVWDGVGDGVSVLYVLYLFCILSILCVCVCVNYIDYILYIIIWQELV
jgi:hypothetical protein